MVECSGFENQRGFTVTGGSNPSLSEIFFMQNFIVLVYFLFIIFQKFLSSAWMQSKTGLVGWAKPRPRPGPVLRLPACSAGRLGPAPSPVPRPRLSLLGELAQHPTLANTSTLSFGQVNNEILKNFFYFL